MLVTLKVGVSNELAQSAKYSAHHGTTYGQKERRLMTLAHNGLGIVPYRQSNLKLNST